MNTLMAKAFFKKTTLFATAFVLAVSTLTAAVPFILSKSVAAAAPYNVTVAQKCENGLVSFDVTGTNPAGTQPAVWVKSSAAFKLSEAQLVQPGTTASLPIKTDVASVPASAATIFTSSDNVNYAWLNEPSAIANYGAFNCYDIVYVATNGSDANAGTTAAAPFATIQKALDTVNANGTVYIADGVYNGTAVIAKNGTKLIGTSGNRDAVEIHVVNNFGGQGGIWADGKSNITIKNLAVVGTPQFTNGGLIKLSNGTDATISNVVVKSGHIVNSSVPRTNTSGINVNGYANVNIDNVYVAGLGKDGISFVGQQNGSVVTKNVALNNISVAGSGWSDLAFNTKDASITGVTFNDVRLQYGDRGLYLDGANTAGVKNQNTVTGVNGGILQLNNTLIKNINNEYINNEQTANVNASGIFVDSQNRPVYEDKVAVKDLTAAELANLRTNFIKDKTNKNGGVVGYGTVFLQGPAAPTNLSPNGWTSSFTKFAWSASADAAKYNVRYSRVHPNEVANAPVLTTANATPEYATTLSDGPLFWQVQSVDAAGNVGAWSDMAYATIDTTDPEEGSNDLANRVRGTITVTQVVTDNIQSKSGKLTVLKNGSVVYTSGDVNVDAQNKVVYTLDTENLFEDGTYTAEFTSTDIVGHSTVTEQTFVVDNTAPALTIVTVTGTQDNTPTITGTADEDATLVATLDGEEVDLEFVDGTWVYNSAEVLANDTYEFKVTATDGIGNVSTRITNFVVNYVTPGVVTPAAPASDNSVGQPDAQDTTAPAVGFPLATNPAGLAAVLGNATDNTDTDNGAGVEGASTENKDTLAAADTEANKGSFLGLSWYWWILIIAALAAIAWWIAAAVRKRQEA